MNDLDLMQTPDLVGFEEESGWQWPKTDGGDQWGHKDVEIRLVREGNALLVNLTAGRTPVKRLALRWKQQPGAGCRLLNDHWERGYGDLQWSALRPGSAFPWYFLLSDGARANGYGVKTGARSLCYWLVDSYCITLVMDVRCGGEGVVLAGKTLQAAEIVQRIGQAGETPFATAKAFCHKMCEHPVLPAQPVYGSNNWYYAYGKSSQAQIEEDSRILVSLAPTGENRPFMVIDDCWQKNRDQFHRTDDPAWVADSTLFPDMEGLVQGMKREGVRPGIWVRPLITTRSTPSNLLLNTGREIGKSADGLVLDPSLPEALEEVAKVIRRFASWGFEMIKHDFTCYDIFGRWGNQFGPVLTEDGWHFADRSKTTAEVILDLYRTIRQNAGGALIIGCNTLSHLSAGLFELQRTGDDTSGQQWERTRRMGVNTLAFRMPQHGAFYAADADCVGLTNNVRWELTEKWLDVLANSGTPLFVSAAPEAMGEAQRRAVARAFEIASKPMPPAEPLDWMETTAPTLWNTHDGLKQYDWNDYENIEPCGGLPAGII